MSALAVVPTADKPKVQDFDTAMDFTEALARWVIRDERAKETTERKLSVVPAAAATTITLYTAEESLAALAESVETVTPEQEQEFLAEFQAALTAATEKRDRVGHFMRHIESQIALAKAERLRLQERERSYQAAYDRLEQYVTHVIKAQGVDAKGKYKKLEGNTLTFSLRGIAIWPEITDEAGIPRDYKSVTMRLPAPMWDAMIECLDLELAATVQIEAKTVETAVSKTKVKAALEAGTEVPGAELPMSAYTLVIK